MSRLRAGHRTAVLRVAAPDRYRIDNRRRHPLWVTCDASRLRNAYHNRVVTKPAQPIPAEFARLLDPAWLLSGWRLTSVGDVTIGDRPAFRLIATLPPSPLGQPPPPDEPAPPDVRVAEQAAASALSALGWLSRQARNIADTGRR